MRLDFCGANPHFNLKTNAKKSHIQVYYFSTFYVERIRTQKSYNMATHHVVYNHKYSTCDIKIKQTAPLLRNRNTARRQENVWGERPGKLAVGGEKSSTCTEGVSGANTKENAKIFRCYFKAIFKIKFEIKISHSTAIFPIIFLSDSRGRILDIEGSDI